jgi:hypothetical protein
LFCYRYRVRATGDGGLEKGGGEEQNTEPKEIGRHTPVDKKVKEARKDKEDL